MQPITPDAHGVSILLLIGAALYLFSRDDLPIESSSLIILIALVTGFHFFPYEKDGLVLSSAEFLSGFGNEALIAVCALMMIGKALETTGALQPVATIVSNTWMSRPLLALLLMLVVVAVLSAFINDTPIVVLMIPILVGVSRYAKTPVSGVMLPMGFATIIGGMSTTIGTSTNLLVVGIAEDSGLEKIGMFDFVLPVLIAGSVGLTFVWLIAPKLLPNRQLPMDDTTSRVFHARLFITEGSFAAGKTLWQVLGRTGGQMRVDRIQRSKNLFLAKLPSVKLQSGDVLFLRDSAENLKRFETLLDATLYNIGESEHPVNEHEPLDTEGQQLAEVVVTRESPLRMHTLGTTQFAAYSGLLPLAIHRTTMPSTRVSRDLNEIRLRTGDVLLVQGTRDAIDKLKSGANMLVLDGTTELPRARHAKRALAVLAAVILANAFGIMPISISAILGVGMMLGLGCLTWRDAASSLPIAVIMIIVTSLALGKALVETGMAVYLAASFVGVAANLPVSVILSTFILIMTVLTNIVSNNAAAVIGTPIAIATAQQLGVDPMPFVLAVLFGANMCFVTPFGYQTNLLILSAGGYKFSDFLKVGMPLAIIMWIAFSIILPVYYDL